MGLLTSLLHQHHFTVGHRLACGGIYHHADVFSFGIVGHHRQLQVAHADGGKGGTLGVLVLLTIVGGNDEIVAGIERWERQLHLFIYIGIGIFGENNWRYFSNRLTPYHLFVVEVVGRLASVTRHDAIGYAARISQGDGDAAFPSWK